MHLVRGNQYGMHVVSGNHYGKHVVRSNHYGMHVVRCNVIHRVPSQAVRYYEYQCFLKVKQIHLSPFTTFVMCIMWMLYEKILISNQPFCIVLNKACKSKTYLNIIALSYSSFYVHTIGTFVLPTLITCLVQLNYTQLSVDMIQLYES